MSIGVNVLLAEEVPVGVQLTDGSTDQFPQAVIRDQSDILIVTLDLNHLANGLYRPAAPFLMPENTFISVQYLTFSDAGHTTPSNFSIPIDIFVLDSSKSMKITISDKIDLKTVDDRFSAKLAEAKPFKIEVKDSSANAQLVDESSIITENQDSHNLRSE